VIREGVGAGGRNDPSLVCTYELKKKSERWSIDGVSNTKRQLNELTL
jgi:hypothetical protein